MDATEVRQARQGEEWIQGWLALGRSCNGHKETEDVSAAQSGAPLGRLDRIHQQHRDRHRPDAAGHRRDPAGDFAHARRSRRRRKLAFGVRFMPTSMTTAPGLTMSAVTRLRRADGSNHDVGLRVTAARSRVALWQMVTVALAASSIMAIGLPTMLLRPMTTACLPRSATPVDSSIFMQP